MRALFEIARPGPLLAAMWLGTLGSPVHAEEYTPPDCGVRALYILPNVEGHRVGLDRIETALRSPHDPRGHSMAELQAAAAACGARLRGLRFEPSDTRPDRPFIAFVEEAGEGHFLVVRPVGSTGTMIQLIEPPFAPRVVDYERFVRGRAWTGRSLVAETSAEALGRDWLPPLLAGGLLLVGTVTLIRRIVRARRRTLPTLSA